MEKSKRELEDLVNSQKEQLSRYEARLKDVVTAYKGLLKEKDALESSLSALTDSKEKPSESNKTNQEIFPSNNINDTSTTTTSNNTIITDNSQSTDLQVQISTLMNSLATLSAEKSRMEASFQGDKKKLRNDLIKKDEIIGQLKDKNKEYEKQNYVDLENMKSKVIIERHEREKETNNHMVMIRELQKLYADERHLKENLEMQLNDLKTEITSSSTPGSKIKELTAELKDLKEKLKQYENGGIKESDITNSDIAFQDNQLILQQLQSEMKHLKQQHSIAIRAEQKRVYVAEERSKKLAALHEDRVANLEARLAELSSTVGTYDRLRQQDQDNIQKLKEKIARFASTSKEPEIFQDQSKKSKIHDKQHDVQTLYEEIVQLKKTLIIENARSPNPIDLNKLFSNNNNGHNDDNQLHDYNTKQQEEYDQLRNDNEQNIKIITEQKNHIKNLQDKVKVLNRNIDEQEVELKFHSERLTQGIKMETSKWKSNLSNLENEYRGKINDMEQQLQKQRVRSLQLLDEKENEIKALKTSFEIFMPQQHQQIQSNELQSTISENGDEISIDGKLRKSSVSHIHSVLNTNSNNQSNIGVGENSHMLHYSNEIARKEVEISGLRKAKYMAESALRQAVQDKITIQEELHDKIENLEELVDRLERCKTREGANLEYLKNVFISFLSTSNAEGKKHMINAIAAVLQFTPAEAKAINIIMFNK